MGGQTGLELEFRQSYIYYVILFLIYYITGYFIIVLMILLLVHSSTEEIDPDEVDDFDELLPFFDKVFLKDDLFILKSFFEDVKLYEEVRLKKNLFKFNNLNYCYLHNLKLENLYFFFLEGAEKRKNEILYVNFLYKRIDIDEDEE